MIQFDGHSATVCSLAFSPDSMTLASGAKDGGVKLWDAAGAQVWVVTSDSAWPRRALAWGAKGDHLAATDGPRIQLLGRDGTVREEHQISLDPLEVSALASVSDRLLAVGTRYMKGGAGGLHLFDVSTRKTRPIPPPIAGNHGVRAIAAHAPTKAVYWLGGLLQTGTELWRSWCITSPNATDMKLGKAASAITVSPDGGTIAIASDWNVRVFTADGKPRTDLTGHKGQVAGVGLIHGGRTVVSASWDETVRFWDVATGKETARFPLGVGKLAALAVSPDGTRIAVGGTDGPIVVIDAE